MFSCTLSAHTEKLLLQEKLQGQNNGFGCHPSRCCNPSISDSPLNQQFEIRFADSLGASIVKMNMQRVCDSKIWAEIDEDQPQIMEDDEPRILQIKKELVQQSRAE